MINADILNELAALGLSGEQFSAVIRVVAKIQAGEDERKAAHRAAQAKYRNSQRKGDITNISPADHHPSPDKEGPQTPKEITLIQDNPSPPKGGSAPQPAKQIRGCRLQGDWQPSPAEVDFAVSEGMSREAIRREAEKFRDYWAARAGAGGVKTDWPATWRNWIRKTSSNGTPHGQRNQQQGLFGADRGGPREDPLITAARREIDGMRGSGWG